MPDSMRLSVVSGRLPRVVITRGCTANVRTVGSHKRYRVTAGGITAGTAVPQHPGDIPNGTLRKIESELAPAMGRKWFL